MVASDEVKGMAVNTQKKLEPLAPEEMWLVSHDKQSIESDSSSL